MISLSKTQISVVQAPIGQPIQVLATAGSGKTRVLTERVRHILENTKKDGVIALTFTNKAAEEMSRRLDEVEGVTERCWIATIHSVAQRVLDQYGHTIGLPSELHIYERDEDRRAVFIESLRTNDIDLDEFLGLHGGVDRRQRETTIQKFMDQISAAKRTMQTEPDCTVLDCDKDEFWFVYHAYQDALLESGGIDFDDILVYAHRILLEQPWVGDIYRAKYKHLCVDEAQDLNRVQYEFIRALCGDSIRSVLMVGDPKQMIYGFNGSASEFVCERFLQDFAPETYNLAENYRSSKSVIRLANKLAPGTQLESVYALEGRVEVESLLNEHDEACWIADKLESLRLLGSHDEIEGRITLEQMVVIGRTRFAFPALQAELKQRCIPFAMNKGERQVEPTSVFGRVLDLGIRVRINPKDWIHGEKLCALFGLERTRDWGDDGLLRVLSNSVDVAEVPYGDIQVELLRAINDLDSDRPRIPKLCESFESRLTESALRSQELDGELERSLQELSDFRECWVLFRRKGLGDSLQSFRNAMALGQLTADSSASGLILSTVHTMKGLEKSIVFLLGMCEGVFPDYRATTPKTVEEERNNAFVAITRARRWLYITYPQRRKMPWGSEKAQSPSRFLREIDRA